MSRYRSERFQNPNHGHALPIEAAVREFLLMHERKGDSESYLRELRSYLIGGSGYFGKQRPWVPLVRWTADQNITTLNDLNKERLGAYLDQVRKIATKGDYGKVCTIVKRLLDFCVRRSTTCNTNLAETYTTSTRRVIRQ